MKLSCVVNHDSISRNTSSSSQTQACFWSVASRKTNGLLCCWVEDAHTVVRIQKQANKKHKETNELTNAVKFTLISAAEESLRFQNKVCRIKEAIGT